MFHSPTSLSSTRTTPFRRQGTLSLLSLLLLGVLVSCGGGAGSKGADGATGPAGTTNLLPWTSITAPTWAMEPNHGYLANGSGPVTFTLPATSALKAGDLLELVGVSSAWNVAQNPGQGITLANGQTWSYLTWPNMFFSMASSSDGTHLVATGGDDSGAGLYTSQDAGITWTTRLTASVMNWQRPTSSSDGSRLSVVGVDILLGTWIYTSSDFGATWIRQPKTKYLDWQAMASSSDGSHLVGCVAYSRITTSPDYGATWTTTSAPTANWSALASSGDGSHLAASNAKGGITYSTDYGVTWALGTLNDNPTPLPAWNYLVSSSDGLHLAASSLTSGTIYVSSDSGATWAPSGTALGQPIAGLVSSGDGSRLAVCGTSGGLALSTDFGATWQATDGGPNAWLGLAGSADLGHLVGFTLNGQGFRLNPGATTAGTPGALLGAKSSSVQLLYVGGGQFLTFSQAGAIQAY